MDWIRVYDLGEVWKDVKFDSVGHENGKLFGATWWKVVNSVFVSFRLEPVDAEQCWSVLEQGVIPWWKLGIGESLMKWKLQKQLL